MLLDTKKNPGYSAKYPKVVTSVSEIEEFFGSYMWSDSPTRRAYLTDFSYRNQVYITEVLWEDSPENAIKLAAFYVLNQ